MSHTPPCPGSCHPLLDMWPLNSFCKLSLQCQHYLTTHCEDIRMTGIDQSPSFAFLMFQVLSIIQMGKVPLLKPNGQEENYDETKSFQDVLNSTRMNWLLCYLKEYYEMPGLSTVVLYRLWLGELVSAGLLSPISYLASTNVQSTILIQCTCNWSTAS